MRILAISGSLRARSSNTSLLLAAARLAPPGVEISLETELGGLPFFNFDLMGREPASVQDFRKRIAAADGLLVSSPEYGHGIPGVLKNALDWLFTGEEIVGKLVALLNASAASVHAPTQLRETLLVMSARFVEAASILVPLPGNHLGVEEMLADAEIAGSLRRAIDLLAEAVSRKS